eukprot:2592303-Alexandrium_andersonii.AAC.1
MEVGGHVRTRALVAATPSSQQWFAVQNVSLHRRWLGHGALGHEQANRLREEVRNIREDVVGLLCLGHGHDLLQAATVLLDNTAAAQIDRVRGQIKLLVEGPRRPAGSQLSSHRAGETC